jgi:hypothetical protein
MTTTTESAALLAAITPEAGKGTTAGTDAFYVATASIHDAIATLLARVAMVQGLRRAADAVEEDPSVFVFFERIKQTLDAAERIGRNAADAVDRCRDVAFQLDQIGVEIRDATGAKALNGHLEALANGWTLVSDAELAHLQERAALAENASAATTTTNGGGGVP